MIPKQNFINMLLHTLFEANPNGYKFELLIVLSLFAIILAIFTIATKSPIYSILYLIGLFIAVSLYLMGHKLYFMGISYILVYVGAISILFLFILMLINVRISELLTEGRNSTVLSILVVAIFSIVFNTKLPNTNNIYQELYNLMDYIQVNWIISYIYNINSTDSFINQNGNLSIVSSHSWDNSMIELSHISSIGNIMYSYFFVILILLGMLLLLAIVGCIIITVKSKDNINIISSNANSDYIKTSLHSMIIPELDYVKIAEQAFRYAIKLINDSNLGVGIAYPIIADLCVLVYTLILASKVMLERPEIIEQLFDIWQQLSNLLQQLSNNDNNISSCYESCDAAESNCLSEAPTAVSSSNENEVLNNPVEHSTKVIQSNPILRSAVTAINSVLQNGIDDNNILYGFDYEYTNSSIECVDADNVGESSNPSGVTTSGVVWPNPWNMQGTIPEIAGYLHSIGLPVTSPITSSTEVSQAFIDSFTNIHIWNIWDVDDVSNFPQLNLRELREGLRSLAEYLLYLQEEIAQQITIYNTYITNLWETTTSITDFINDYAQSFEINSINLLNFFDNANQFNFELDQGPGYIINSTQYMNDLLEAMNDTANIIEHYASEIRARTSSGNGIIDRDILLDRDIQFPERPNVVVSRIQDLHLNRGRARQVFIDILEMWKQFCERNDNNNPPTN